MSYEAAAKQRWVDKQRAAGHCSRCGSSEMISGFSRCTRCREIGRLAWHGIKTPRAIPYVPVLLGETWKPCPSWPRYEASTMGRVRYAQDGRVRTIYYGKSGHGYIVVGSSPRRTFGVHRLIADAFHGPCPLGKEVSHKNHKPWENHPGNLEYLTHRENMAESAKIGRFRKKEPLCALPL